MAEKVVKSLVRDSSGKELRVDPGKYAKGQEVRMIDDNTGEEYWIKSSDVEQAREYGFREYRLGVSAAQPKPKPTQKTDIQDAAQGISKPKSEKQPDVSKPNIVSLAGGINYWGQKQPEEKSNKEEVDKMVTSFIDKSKNGGIDFSKVNNGNVKMESDIPEVNEKSKTMPNDIRNKAINLANIKNDFKADTKSNKVVGKNEQGFPSILDRDAYEYRAKKAGAEALNNIGSIIDDKVWSAVDEYNKKVDEQLRGEYRNSVNNFDPKYLTNEYDDKIQYIAKKGSELKSLSNVKAVVDDMFKVGGSELIDAVYNSCFTKDANGKVVGFTDDIKRKASSLGKDPYEFVNNYVIPGVANKAYDSLDEKIRSQFAPKDFVDYAAGKLGQSVLGTINALLYQSKEERQMRAEEMEKSFTGNSKYYNPNVLERFGASTIGMLGDLPAFSVGGKVSSMVAKYTPKMIGLVSPKVASFLSPMASDVLIGANKGFFKTAARRVASGIAPGYANLFTYGAISGALNEASVGEDSSFASIAMAGLKQGNEMGVLGMILPFGGTWGNTASLFAKSRAGVLKSKAAGFLGEAGAMIGYDAATQGNDFTLVGSSENALTMMLGLRLAGGKWIGTLGNIANAKGGFRAGLANSWNRFVSPKNISQFKLSNAEMDRIKSVMPGIDIYTMADVGNSNKEVHKNFATAMTDKSIPWETRNKISAVTLNAASGVRPRTQEYKINSKDKVIEFISDTGESIAFRDFNNMEDAASIVNTELLRRDSYDVLTNLGVLDGLAEHYESVMGKQDVPVGSDRIYNETATSNNVDVDDVKIAVAKDPLRRTKQEHELFLDVAERTKTKLSKELQGAYVEFLEKQNGESAANKVPEDKVVDETTGSAIQSNTFAEAQQEYNKVLNVAKSIAADFGLDANSIDKFTIDDLVKLDSYNERELEPLYKLLQAKIKMQKAEAFDNAFNQTIESKIREQAENDFSTMSFNGTIGGGKDYPEGALVVTNGDKSYYVINGELDSADLGTPLAAKDNGMVILLDTDTNEIRSISSNDANNYTITSIIDKNSAIDSYVSGLYEKKGIEQPAQPTKTTETSTTEPVVGNRQPKVEQPTKPTVQRRDGIVIDDKGKKLYTHDETSAEAAVNDIYKAFSKEDGDAYIDEKLSGAKKALDKIKKPITRNKNEEPDDFVARKERQQQDILNAQKEVDRWQEIYDFAHFSDDIDSDKVLSESEKKEILENLSNDPIMIIAMNIPKITPESFRAETGLNPSDIKGGIGVLAKKENGGMSVANAAEKIRESLFGESSQYDDNEIRSIIIDILSSGGRATFIKNYREQYIAKYKEALADNIRNSMDSEYMNAYHMSYKDYKNYIETRIQRTIEEMSGVDFDALDNFLADKALDKQEQINKQNENGESKEVDNNTTGDGDNRVLPKEQIDNGGGDKQGETEQGGTEEIGSGTGTKTGTIQESTPVDLDSIIDKISNEGFAGETEEESLRFESLVPNMTDEQLLISMSAQDMDKPVHPSVFDEYDKRHQQEYDDTVSMVSDSLEKEGIPADTAEEYLASAEKEYKDGGWYSSDRTKLAAQIDALRQYIDSERSVEVDTKEPTDTDVNNGKSKAEIEKNVIANVEKFINETFDGEERDRLLLELNGYVKDAGQFEMLKGGGEFFHEVRQAFFDKFGGVEAWDEFIRTGEMPESVNTTKNIKENDKYENSEEGFDIESRKDEDYNNLGYSEPVEYSTKHGTYIIEESLFIDGYWVGLHSMVERTGVNPIHSALIAATSKPKEIYELYIDVDRHGWEVYGKNVEDHDWGDTISFNSKDELMDFIKQHPDVLKSSQDMYQREIDGKNLAKETFSWIDKKTDYNSMPEEEFQKLADKFITQLYEIGGKYHYGGNITGEISDWFKIDFNKAAMARDNFNKKAETKSMDIDDSNVNPKYANRVKKMSDEELLDELNYLTEDDKRQKSEADDRKARRKKMQEDIDDAKENIDKYEAAYQEEKNKVGKELYIDEASGDEYSRDVKNRVEKVENVIDENSSTRSLMATTRKLAEHIENMLDELGDKIADLSNLESFELDEVNKQLNDAEQIKDDIYDWLDTIRDADTEDKEDCANEFRDYLNDICYEKADENNLRKVLETLERVKNLDDKMLENVNKASETLDDKRSLIEDGADELKSLDDWIKEDDAMTSNELDFVSAVAKSRGLKLDINGTDTKGADKFAEDKERERIANTPVEKLTDKEAEEETNRLDEELGSFDLAEGINALPELEKMGLLQGKELEYRKEWAAKAQRLIDLRKRNKPEQSVLDDVQSKEEQLFAEELKGDKRTSSELEMALDGMMRLAEMREADGLFELSSKAMGKVDALKKRIEELRKSENTARLNEVRERIARLESEIKQQEKEVSKAKKKYEKGFASNNRKELEKEYDYMKKTLDVLNDDLYNARSYYKSLIKVEDSKEGARARYEDALRDYKLAKINYDKFLKNPTDYIRTECALGRISREEYNDLMRKSPSELVQEDYIKLNKAKQAMLDAWNEYNKYNIDERRAEQEKWAKEQEQKKSTKEEIERDRIRKMSHDEIKNYLLEGFEGDDLKSAQVYIHYNPTDIASRTRFGSTSEVAKKLLDKIERITNAFVEDKNHVRIEEVKRMFDIWNRDADGNVLDKDMQGLFDLVYEKMRYSGLTFRLIDNNRNLGGDAFYDGLVQYGRRYLYNPSKDNNYRRNLIIHELIHTIEQHAIEVAKGSSFAEKYYFVNDKMLEGAKELLNIYEQVMANTGKGEIFEKYVKSTGKGDYGTKNAHEMVADMFKLRDRLKQLKLWERFKNGIKKFLGIDSDSENGDKQTDAYEGIRNALDKLLDNFEYQDYQQIQAAEGKTRLRSSGETNSNSVNDKFAERLKNAKNKQEYLDEIDTEIDRLERFIDESRNVNEYNEAMLLIGELEKEKERINNVGFHRGDLGKSESLPRMYGTSRSTGHFGTGTYFTGDKITGYNSRNGVEAPDHSVDFSQYNLFRPKTTQQGRRLHELLKWFNNTFFKYDTDKINNVADFDKIKNRAEDIVDNAELIVNDGVLCLNDSDFETLNSICKSIYGKDRELEDNTYRTAEEFVYELGRSYRGETLRDVVSEIEGYGNKVSELANLIGVDAKSVNNAVNRISKELDGYRMSQDPKGGNYDSGSTRLMKALGFEGIDVRGLEGLDDTDFGSVIYDLDKNSILYRDDSTSGDGKNMSMGTFFSGGGLIEAGLHDIMDSKFAVEYDKKIAGIYQTNWGDNIIIDDVALAVDKVAKMVDGHVDYFHASPVCHNFSKAKGDEAVESEVDIKTAKATAEAIRKVTPDVFTLENAPSYANSKSIEEIKSVLRELGYEIDEKVYNAANYGAATSRRRLILRAVKPGLTIPPIPAHIKPKGWLEVTSDLIDGLRPIKLSNKVRRVFEEKGIDYTKFEEPTIVFDAGRHFAVSMAKGSEPAPTITASGDMGFVILPGGDVRECSPRLLARIMGLPDSYVLPRAKKRAKQIIGNGVPVELTKAIITPLVKSRIEERKEKVKITKAIDKEYVNAANKYLKARDSNSEKAKEAYDKAFELFNKYVLEQADDGITPFLVAGKYRVGEHRKIANALKEKDADAVRVAAEEIANILPSDCVLVPMPSHLGYANDTKVLAEAVSRITGNEVIDALEGFSRESVRVAKEKRHKFTPEGFGFRLKESLPEGKQVVIIDNVIASGTTAAAASRATKGGLVVGYAYAENIKPIAGLKSAEPITFNSNGNVIPLSERFNAKNKNINYKIGNNSVSEGRRESLDNIISTVNEVNKSLGGKAVNMHESVETIHDEGVKARIARGDNVMGWYDRRNGSVHLFLPNIHSRYDAEKTVLHEKVGHAGLEGFFGKDLFKEFMHKLWYDKDSGEMRKWVAQWAAKNQHKYYDGICEYLAQQAETNNSNTFWSKVTDLFYSVATKLGIMRPSVNDMRYLMWLSRNYIKNGYDNPMDIAKRKSILNKMRSNPIKAETLENDMRLPQSERDALIPETAFKGSTSKDPILTPKGFSATRRYNDALRNASYIHKEAHIDKYQAAKELVKAITGKGFEKLSSNTDFVDKLYAAPSIADNRMRALDVVVDDVVTDVVLKAAAAFEGKEPEKELESYLYKKTALERNRIFYIRDVLKALGKKTLPEDIIEYKIIRGAYDKLRNEFRGKQAPFDVYINKLDEFILDNLDKHYDVSKYDKTSGLNEIDGGKYRMEDGTYDDVQVLADVMDAESKMGKDTTDKLWEMLRELTDLSLSNDYEYGLISRDQKENAQNMFEYYLPLRGWAEETAEDAYSYMNGNSQMVSTNTLEHAKGRSSEAFSPLTTAIAMAYSSINRGVRNSAKQSFLRFVRENPSDLVTETKLYCLRREGADGEVEYVPLYPNLTEDIVGGEKMKNVLDDYYSDIEKRRANGEDIVPLNQAKGNIAPPVKRQYDFREHVIEVSVGGKKHYFVVNGHPRAAQAINGMIHDEVSNNWVAHKIKGVTRGMSQLATSYSWSFATANGVRDAFELAPAFLYAKEDGKYLGKYFNNYKKLVFHGSNDGGMFSLARRYKEGKLNENSEVDRMYKEFVENGGVTGYVSSFRIEDAERKLDKIYDELHKGKVKQAYGNCKEALGLYGELVSGVAEGIENATRFATYMTSRQMGRGITRCIADAKNVSSNFNRTGSGSAAKNFHISGQRMGALNNSLAGMSAHYLKNYIMFYNAGVQGLYNMHSAFFKNGAKGAAKMITSYFAIPFAFGALAPIWNAALANLIDNDEDRKKYGDNPYNQLPDYERRTKLNFYIGHGKWITVPVGIDLRFGLGLGDMVAGLMYDKKLRNVDIVDPENPISVGGQLVAEIAEQFSQITPVDFASTRLYTDLANGDPLKKVALGYASALTPSIVQPFVSVARGYSWTGSKITRENAYNENTPQYKKGARRVGKTYRDISEQLNKIGGNDVKTGWININPSNIEYLVNQYFGGPGKDMNEVISTVSTIVDKDAYNGKAPILKNFYRGLTPDNSKAVTTARYNNYRREAKEIMADYNDYKKEEKKGNYLAGERRRAMERTEAFLRASIIEHYSKRISKLWKLREKYEADREQSGIIQGEINDAEQEVVRMMDIIEENRKKGMTPEENEKVLWR